MLGPKNAAFLNGQIFIRTDQSLFDIGNARR